MVAKTPKLRLDFNLWRPALRQGLRQFTRDARGRRVRSRIEFCEQIIRVAEGPHVGKRWRRKYQPFAWHLLHLMDTAGFQKFRVTGCVQSGKTTNASIVNILWHLFERREDVICGIPQLKMAENIWTSKILPIIAKAPELRQYLPLSGATSRGGFGDLIAFRHGAKLKFMGGGGSDDERSSFTAPVVIKMEVDRYDLSTAVSREDSPPEQMEARIESYGDDSWSYEECTCTTEAGRIFQEVQEGTGSTLYYQCPHCREAIRPMRDDFVGIEDCLNVREARAMGTFKCPTCAEIVTEEHRQVMLDAAVPVHRGQLIKMGTDGAALIEGDLPATDKLSFWWNAFDNRFWTSSHIAAGEWRAMYSRKQSSMDKNRRQFAWALPAERDDFDIVALTASEVSRRTGMTLHAIVPPHTRWLSAGVDLRQTQLHYLVRAWTEAEGVIEGLAIDIGTVDVDTKGLGVRLALLEALRTFRDKRILPGYRDADGSIHAVGWSLVDTGWMEHIVWEFMLECAALGIKGWMPSVGRGQSEPPGKGTYNHPEKLSEKVLWIGENYHIRKSSRHEADFAAAGVASPPAFVMANSDEWKSFVHDGYATPLGQPGALGMYSPTTAEERKALLKHAQQLVAEGRRRKVVPGRGPVDVWRNDSGRSNHGLDTEYMASVGGHMCGVRVAVKRRQSTIATPVEKKHPITMPDGRPFMAVAT